MRSANLVLVLVLALVGCGEDRQPAPPVTGDASGFDQPPSPGAEVVATVNGARIYVEEVARQAAATNATPRAALDELIRIELLFQEAARRGLLDDRDVVEAHRSAQVRAIISRDFEARLATPEQVPERYLAQAWQNPSVNSYFNHPKYQVVSYVRVLAPAPGKAGPEVEAKAKRDALVVHQRIVAARPADRDAFLIAANAIGTELGIKLESSGTTNLPVARHGSHVEPFAKAAFELEKVGDVTRPARTDWGWDVLFLVEVLPESALTLQQAAPELRQKIFDRVRQMEFAIFTEEILKRTPVQRDDTLLEKVVVESPLAGAP